MPAPLARIFAPDQTYSPDISPFKRYTDMLARFEAALNSTYDTPHEWLRIILSLQNKLPVLQIVQVNEIMNKRPYVSEIRDYWATPVEFLKYGGDCEDFAIAKYLALRTLGHAEENMRIVIVDDLQKNMPHAILAVRQETGECYVLDNQDKAVKRLEFVHRYSPVYSINRTGWWYHRTRLVA